MRAIERAVEAAGGQADLAGAIGCSRAFVNQMASGNRPVPIDLRPAIEAATGVRCEDFGTEVEWVRNKAGKVTHYRTSIPTAAVRRKAAA